MTKTKDTEKAAMEQSARIAAEAVSNIRTVASLRKFHRNTTFTFKSTNFIKSFIFR